MEAGNYQTNENFADENIKDDVLHQALHNGHQQIKNIAEIIQRINPDIILLNEFDRTDNTQDNLSYFLKHYLAVGQHNQQGISYPHYYQGPVNTGVPISDTNTPTSNDPSDNYGYGYFPGHFAMALLSKYPINFEQIRTFQFFKWHHMPNALQPISEGSNQSWKERRLSSKSHWDIPITVNKQVIHLLASHPTPPVFDGPDQTNARRNHDEIRFWHDYIDPEKNHYIYDDNQQGSGLKNKDVFIILGDLNASNVEGQSKSCAINKLLTDAKIQDPLPTSLAASLHSPNNPHAANHTCQWRLRADYILLSNIGWKIHTAGVFWPQENETEHRLIANRQASSDHYLVWVKAQLHTVNNVNHQ